MNNQSLSAFIVATIVFAPLIKPLDGWAQTPAQIEYERQQREYRQQQERQRQEQQRLQQLMNENARRQQEETNRAARASAPNTPSSNPITSTSRPSAAPGGSGQSVRSSAISQRRYALPGQRIFVVQVPGNWTDRLQRAADGSATITFSPATGNGFRVLVTALPEAKDHAPPSREQLRARVEGVAKAAKSWAVESHVPVQEIEGRSGPGFYFSATERAPTPGAHKFVTSGGIGVGPLTVGFTITTSEGHASVVSEALNLVRTAVLDGAATAAGPRATPSGGLR